MFDTYEYINRNQSHSHLHNHQVNITEIKAPTDESLRLLYEMEQKTIDSIVYKGEIKNNTLSAEFYFFKEGMTFTYTIAVKLKLNDNVYILKDMVLLDYYDELLESNKKKNHGSLTNNDFNILLNKAHSLIATKISEEILKSLPHNELYSKLKL